MVLNSGTINALNILLQILVYSLGIATPVIVILILLYQYDKYIKWTKREEKEAERIIVKMNKEIIETTNSIESLKPIKEKLESDIEELEKRAAELRTELQEEEVVDSEPDLNELTVKDLHQLAKERGLKGYSRLPKDKIIELLQ